MDISGEFKKGIILVAIIEAIILFVSLLTGDSDIISLVFWGTLFVDAFVAICYLIIYWLTKY